MKERNCVGYTFGQGDGLIGRVFQTQLPEYSPQLSYYSLKEHPLRDLALSCGFTATCAFPIFDPSHQSCVGVLELLCSISIFYFRVIASSLKLVGLVTIDAEMIQKKILEGTNYEAEIEEIKGPLQQVYEAHSLSLACVWARCKGSNSSSDCTVRGRGDFVILLPDLLHADWFFKAYPALLSQVTRVGQGLVGNAFLSDKPFLCTNMTQLSMSMILIARQLSFTGCITICLQSTATRNRDYVLQFYLPVNMTGITIHQFYSSMVATLKRHLKCFEPVVVDPGDELFGEVDKYSIYSDFDSLEFTPPTIINETEAGALPNEGEVLQANFPGHRLDGVELANSGGGSVEDHQLRAKGFAMENNYLEKKSSTLSEGKHSEKKSKTHNQKESSCFYDTLQQHFGRKLEDAAESLGVSRSTVKRWCRENNINRWPFPKRSKFTSLPPISKPIIEPIQGNSGHISNFTRENPSSADVPTVLAPMRAMSTIMVKAKYKNDFIKFQLPFSSRMIELVEKVTLRLKLSEGAFTVKYLDVDGDYILITCDEDLEVCINSFTEGNEIKMLIEPLAIIIE